MVNAMLLKVKSAMMVLKCEFVRRVWVRNLRRGDDGKALRMNVATDLSQLQFQTLA